MSAQDYSGKHAYHGDIAARYDEDRVSEPLWAQEQDFVGKWVKTLPADATVLDVPVGTGRFLPIYAECGLRVHGCDISADMIAAARQRHAALADSVNLTVGDAEHLPFADQSVDNVLCWRLVHLLPPSVLGRILREFRRVARREILVQALAVRLADPASAPWRAVKAVLRPLWRRLHPLRDVQPWSHITNFEHTENSLRALFADAGLAVHAVTEMDRREGLAVLVFYLRRT